VAMAREKRAFYSLELYGRFSGEGAPTEDQVKVEMSVPAKDYVFDELGIMTDLAGFEDGPCPSPADKEIELARSPKTVGVYKHALVEGARFRGSVVLSDRTVKLVLKDGVPIPRKDGLAVYTAKAEGDIVWRVKACARGPLVSLRAPAAPAAKPAAPTEESVGA